LFSKSIEIKGNLQTTNQDFADSLLFERKNNRNDLGIVTK